MRLRLLNATTVAWLVLAAALAPLGAQAEEKNALSGEGRLGRRGQEEDAAVASAEAVSAGPSDCCDPPKGIPQDVLDKQIEVVNMPKEAIESGANKGSPAPPDSLVITVPGLNGNVEAFESGVEVACNGPDCAAPPDGEEGGAGEDNPTLEDLGVQVADTSMEGGGFKPIEFAATSSAWGVTDPEDATSPVSVGHEGDSVAVVVATTTMMEEPSDGLVFRGTGLDAKEVTPTVVDVQLVEYLESTEPEPLPEEPEGGGEAAPAAEPGPAAGAGSDLIDDGDTGPGPQPELEVPQPQPKPLPGMSPTGMPQKENTMGLLPGEDINREREHTGRNLRQPAEVPHPPRRRHGDGGRANREAAAAEHEANRVLQATQGISTFPIGLFNPLACNAAVMSASCSPKLSSLLSGTAKVTVPCGTCYTYDLPKAPTTIDGLDVVGRLVVPQNYKSTLLTKFVFVQGVLEMSDTNPISKNNTSMRIVLTGDADVTFVPASGNAGVAGSTFNAGVKPFLVAGGRLDIRGWSGSLVEGGTVETWTTLTKTAEGARPNPILSAVPGKERTAISPPAMVKAGGVEPEQCPSKLVDHDFDVTNEVDYQVWSGGEGMILHHAHDQGGAIEAAPILTSQHGFKLDFSEIARQCPLIAGATYLVTMRLKIDPLGIAPGTKSNCEINGSDCPRLVRKILRTSGGDRASEQVIRRGNMGRYGEWFWFSTEWKWTGDDLTNVYGNLFVVDRFPVNATVLLDYFVFELPSSKSYAPQSEACVELAVNGRAEDNDGAGFSHYPFLSDLGTTNPLVTEETVSGIVNRFYRIRARSSQWLLMQFRPNPDCFVKGHVYTVSLRTRLYSYTSGKLKIAVRLSGKKPNGDWLYPTILTCPEMTQSDAWTSCSATLLIGEELVGLTETRFEFMTDMEDANNRAFVDFDDISMKYTRGPAEGLSVNTAAISRWAANSDIHITSSTLNWKDSQDAVIDSIQAKDDGSSILKLNVGIVSVLSEEETPGMGVEVALLTRNIKIEGETRVDLCGTDRIKQSDYRGTISTTVGGFTCQKWTAQAPWSHTRTPANFPSAGLGDHNYCRNPDGPESGQEKAWCYTTNTAKQWDYCNVPMCRGGYLQVLHTPNVAQVIEGVEMTNMGQQGFKNRFPIQFLYTRDVKGTSISRNSIRTSAHRCISMDGVSNATIAANVAHDTAGHCYYIGLEANQNSILYNIGSKTNDLIAWGEQLAGHSDHDRATFFLRSSENDYIGNIAAGSAGRGFDFSIHWAFYGEDECYFCNGIDPNRRSNRQKPMGIFRSNKAHSNFWQGFKLENFEQFYAFRNMVNVPKFENTLAYRNREQGILTWNNVAAEYLGGKLSDNQWGIIIRVSDRVMLQDYDIVGSSKIFYDHLVQNNRPLTLCSSSGWRHEGIMMMSTIWQTGDLDPALGLRLRSVNISGFDKEKQWYPNCMSTEAIAISPDLRDKHFDYISSAQNVKISDSRGIVMDGCQVAASYGVKDIVITDMGGSFDPSKNGTSGSLVHDYEHVKGILGVGACSSIGKCLAFCPNACLRTFSLKVEQFGTDNWKLRIKSTLTGFTMDVPGTIFTINNAYFSDPYAGRRFSASLPAGIYTAEFINQDGARVWPQYVEETWNKPPDCTGFATIDSITLLKPAINEQLCADLIRNGGNDGDIFTTQPWITTLGQPRDLVVRTGLGVGGTNAIGTVNREYHWTGLGQDIDSRCLELMKGEFYEFSAYTKVTVKNNPTIPIGTINPNRDMWQNLSPVVTMNIRSYRNISNKEFLSNWETQDNAFLARPYNISDFNLLHGIFRLPNTFRAFFEIERSPDNTDFLIDNVSFKRMVCDPEKLLLNGDFEEPKTKYWDTWGGDVSLGLVAGYGGKGQALKAFTRPHLSHGPAQIMNTDCVPNAGERLAFSGKIRFEKSAAPGVTAPCNPFTWSDSLIRCSDVWMFTQKAGISEYNRVAMIHTDESAVDNGWYNIHGLWTLRPNQAKADFTKIYFDGISTAYDVIIDNIQVKRLPLQCNTLVENPSFSNGSSAFWQATDRDRMKLNLYSPGADGPGDFALRAYNRDHQWRGIRQQLDKRCFVTGEEYTISAKFRLLNATSGAGLHCLTNDQWMSGKNCPSVMIYGEGCAQPTPNIYWRFWNTEQGWQKDAYNNFSNRFIVNAALSSCLNVWVQIQEISKEQEIVMDDLQISKVQTPAPTRSPTAVLTVAVEEVETTVAPSDSPTSMPTVSTITSCPSADSVPTEIPSGPVKLARSEMLCVLTKAVPDSNGALSLIAPVALSYDNGAWEKAAGEFAMKLLYGQEFGDYSDGSQITLPDLNNTGKYYLTSYSHTVSETDKVARLLETATFGTTITDLASFDNLTADTAKEWIITQMNLNLTSHRQYFRNRANPRLTNPVGVARNGHPCDPVSRWRKFTFSKKEGENGVFFPQRFEATKQNSTSTYITIKLNGHVRSVVKSLAFAAGSKFSLEFNREYVMCWRPEEWTGGWFYLRMSDGSCQAILNPIVNFYSDSAQPHTVLSLPDLNPGILDPIDEVRSRGGEFILRGGLNDPICSQLNDVMEENDAPVFGRLNDGSWLMFDPRMDLEENTLKSHIADGGGLVRSLTALRTKCANAPRTFLNEEQCSLADSSMACGSAGTPSVQVELIAENIIALHDLTGQYVYAIVGLPLRDNDNVTQPSPCVPNLRSRWEILDAAQCTQTFMGAETNATLVKLLQQSATLDLNPGLRDITFPITGMSCSSNHVTLVEAEIIINSKCFRRVHPEHLSVFDFTYWTEDDTHPGNMIAAMNNHPNPITKWMDLNRSAILLYPAKPPSNPNSTLRAHPIHRWDMYSPRFPKVGRFGDIKKFVDLPNEIRTVEVAEYFGADTAVTGGGILVCGSPYETSNDLTKGYVFEVSTERETDWDLSRQREFIWTQIGLTAPDQLRQRVAWAFAQFLVVARGAIEVEGSHTESFLTYYDIFVRNAFGNYRDMLREISYSALMAENLSMLASKSAAYMWENQQIVSFADENFAREIMQLFTTGLSKLNLDGTPVLDGEGQPVLAYTNDEIMSFARVWTGFDYQQGRGNVEDHTNFGNRHDPMKIQAGWRDKFPKTDMAGGYIGDRYPICSDLPAKMFLKKGARYRLLGQATMPELVEDDPMFNNDPTLKRFVLAANSSLKTELCNADPSGNCRWENTVTLAHNLGCTSNECGADTLRVVRVSDGIHYEYVRPACVEQAFYANAKKIIYKERWAASSCANPLLPYASEACCAGTHDLTAERAINYLYDQERVTYSTAGARCAAMGMGLCDFNDITGIAGHKKGFHWTTDSCAIKVKVNAIGQVALVYEPRASAFLHPHIRNDNRNFFKVYWDGDANYPKNDNDVTTGNSCGGNACETLATGGCLCDTVITESRVFKGMPKSVDEVLSKLSVGAHDTDAYPPGTFAQPVTANGVTAYLANATGAFDTNTVLEVTDDNGRLHRLKNTRSMVAIQGGNTYSFRNPPSFMSVLNTEANPREAYYETEAALDHYFYHDNTAPFIALRLIQRFTTSNPTPRYVKEVATAFRTGSYEEIGKGKYGDLAATIAAVLLDKEARSVAFDANPFKGSLREPLLRLMALMRGMELQLAEGQPIVKLYDLDVKIGMMAHCFRTVFGYFLPEYKSNGRPGEASLVGPETMLVDMPKTVGMLNGMFSLVKYGLSGCYGGFGTGWSGCTEGDFTRATARLSFSRPYNKNTTTPQDQAENVVSELSTIFTSGRLSDANKQIIKDAYISKLNQTSLDPAGAALRVAQQLMLTTPEFHTTNTIRKTGTLRALPKPPPPSGVTYKAVVYVLFGGGCDSYNMLVPHTCSKINDDMTLWDEYKEIRQGVALDHASLKVLNGNMTNQDCETFGVHPRLGSLQKLFNDRDLLFFTNTGELTKETDKENYWRDTKTQLFAHNFQQQAAQRIDPLKAIDGTGILGRIRDILVEKKGRNVGAYSLNVNSMCLIGEPGTTSTPMIVSDAGATPFNQYPSLADMDSRINLLNGKTEAESGVFADFHAEAVIKSLSNNKVLVDTLTGKTTQVVFPTSGLGKQLSMVAKMIDSRAVRNSDADMFFVETGGWDTHDMLLPNQERLFTDVDASFKAFADEMKAKNIWDSVTVIETSDFARTLSPNGNDGSDHAWAGNYVMFGGSVKGGQIVGKYPSIRENAPLNIGRGRMIPTTSWEAVFLPIAEWAGVDKADFDFICPNRNSFPVTHFTPATSLFDLAANV